VALQASSDEAGINVTTQLAKDDVEKLGLLKMDFLGLRNMTVISDALRWIKERYGIDVDLNKLPKDDSKVMRCFQLEKQWECFSWKVLDSVPS